MEQKVSAGCGSGGAGIGQGQAVQCAPSYIGGFLPHSLSLPASQSTPCSPSHMPLPSLRKPPQLGADSGSVPASVPSPELKPELIIHLPQASTQI